MRKIRLSESSLRRIVKRIINESPLGKSMLEKLYHRLYEKFPNVEYSEGDKQFEPYIYIHLTKKTGLLIEMGSDDNFVIHYDDGVNDNLWLGWKKEIDKLNSVKNAFDALMILMEK